MSGSHAAVRVRCCVTVGAYEAQGAGKAPFQDYPLAPYRSSSRASGGLSHAQSQEPVTPRCDQTRSGASLEQQFPEDQSSRESAKVRVMSHSKALELAHSGSLRDGPRGGEVASHSATAGQASKARTEKRHGGRSDRRTQGAGRVEGVRQTGVETSVDAARAAALHASTVTTYLRSRGGGSEDDQPAVTGDGMCQERREGRGAGDVPRVSDVSSGAPPYFGRSIPGRSLPNERARKGRPGRGTGPAAGVKAQEGLLGVQLPSGRESSRDSIASSRNGRTLLSEAAQAANVRGLELSRPGPVMVLPSAKRGVSSATSLAGATSQPAGASQLRRSQQDMAQHPALFPVCLDEKSVRRAINHVATSPGEHGAGVRDEGDGISAGLAERQTIAEDRKTTREGFRHSDFLDSRRKSSNSLLERDISLHRLASPPLRLRELGATASPDALPATPSSLALPAGPSRERRQRSGRRGMAFSSEKATSEGTSSNGLHRIVAHTRGQASADPKAAKHAHMQPAVSEQCPTELVAAQTQLGSSGGDARLYGKPGRDEKRSPSEKLGHQEKGAVTSPGRRQKKVPPQRFSVMLLRDGSISSEGGVYLPVMQDATPRPSLCDENLAAAEQAAFLLHQEAQRTGQADPAAAILSSRTASFGSSVDKNKSGRQDDPRQGPSDPGRQPHISSSPAVSAGEGGRRRSAALAALSASDELPGLQQGGKRGSRRSWPAARRGEDCAAFEKELIPSPNALLLQQPAQVRARGRGEASESSIEGGNDGTLRAQETLDKSGVRGDAKHSTVSDAGGERPGSAALTYLESRGSIAGIEGSSEDAGQTRFMAGRGGSVSKTSEVFVSAASVPGPDTPAESSEED